MDEQKETFHYTYSAAQQAEIKSIREKYAPSAPEEDKMERLRKLDASATKPGTVASLVIGIISTLIFGVGMCCVMVWGETLFLPGIVIGVLGILGLLSAYPIYNRVTKRRREKLAPEILRLSEELME